MTDTIKYWIWIKSSQLFMCYWGTHPYIHTYKWHFKKPCVNVVKRVNPSKPRDWLSS
jgi:hypothetical protein